MNESDYLQRQLAYVRTRQLQAEITMQAMIAANREREIRGESPAYGEAAFMALIDEYGIHHNAFFSEVQPL